MSKGAVRRLGKGSARGGACRECRSPWVQDPLVLGQLPHEAGVGSGDAPLLPDEAVGLLQGPAVLLHGVGDHRGRRAAHAHLAVHQTLGVVLPVGGPHPRSIRGDSGVRKTQQIPLTRGETPEMFTE